MSGEICICCGRPLEAARGRIGGLAMYAHNRTVERAGACARLTRAQFAIFEELFHHYPGAVSVPEVVEAIYGDDDSALFERRCAVVKVTVSILRRRLRPLGLEIPSNTKWRLGYRLARSAA